MNRKGHAPLDVGIGGFCLMLVIIFFTWPALAAEKISVLFELAQRPRGLLALVLCLIWWGLVVVLFRWWWLR